MTKIPFNEAKHGNKLSLQCLLLSIEGFHLLLYLIQYLKEQYYEFISGNNEHHRISIIRNK